MFWSHFVYGKHQVEVSEEPVHFTLTFAMKRLVIFSSKHLSDLSYSEMGHKVISNKVECTGKMLNSLIKTIFYSPKLLSVLWKNNVLY